MKRISSLLVVLAFAIQPAWALDPSRTYKQRPARYDMDYETHHVRTNDGNAELLVWSFKANAATSDLVLIAHNGEGNMADYLRRIDQFTHSGYNVVIFDYRGYGESSQFAIDAEMYIYPHFQNDMETMIDFCRRSGAATFDLYGWGIGAGLALGIGYSRPEIRKIVADTPFLSMEDLESRFQDQDEPRQVPFAGCERRHEPVHASAEGTRGPNLESVLLILGSHDELFRAEDMETLRSTQDGLRPDHRLIAALVVAKRAAAQPANPQALHRLGGRLLPDVPVPHQQSVPVEPRHPVVRLARA